ncbi:MAG: ABC transporter permease [Chloroflexota bacterium]
MAAVKSLTTTQQNKVSKPRTMWGDVWRKLSWNLPAMMGLTVIIIFYLTALSAPILVTHEYDEIDWDNIRAGPSIDHFFGTDELGRDVFSRLVWASRSAAFVSIFVPIFSLTLGIFFGTLAGYFPGWIDTLIMRIVDVLFAFPGLLLVLLMAATVRPGYLAWLKSVEIIDFSEFIKQGYADYVFIFSVLGLIGWGSLARIVRGQFLTLREREFVLAARSLGSSQLRIAFKHVLPNALPPVIIIVSGGIGGTIAAETTLSFLGIGLQIPNPSWGAMINEYYPYLRQPDLWVLLFIPCFILATIIMAFTFFGDGLNEAMNPYLD